MGLEMEKFFEKSSQWMIQKKLRFSRRISLKKSKIEKREGFVGRKINTIENSGSFLENKGRVY